MMTMKEAAWALRIAAAAAAISALPMAAPFAAVAADPALGAPPAVTVPEASVLSSPYTVELAPTGELRVISFPDALVSSVVVAKPWLLTVLVQGHDAVLQAKASGGETQVIVYAGGAGTLWNVVIAPHKPAASRIVVSAAPREAASPAPGLPARPGTGQAAPAVPRALAAFAGTLGPQQRAAFEAWRRDPTMKRLSDFLAALDATQRAEFERLVGAGDVTLPGAQAAPRVVETTTVIRAPAEPQRAADGASATAAAPGGQEAPRAAQPLYAYPEDVPSGITVAAQAEQAGSGIVVRYAIHNGLGVGLERVRVAAVDGHGTEAVAADSGPRAVAPGADARGAVSVAASALPVTLRWTWGKASKAGAAEFYVLVTH